MTYSLRGYSSMIADGPRVDAYVAALERVVRPGMTVLDLGAGSGFFSFEACRLGARRVYAIDPNPALFAAREAAVANGLQDRIVFLSAASTSVTLPERVDVVVSDMRGVLPLHASHIPSLVDARTRFLAPGGVLLPWRDTLVVAVVEVAELHRKHLEPWGGRPSVYTAAPIARMLANTWDTAFLPADAQLTAPASWATIDYHTATSPDVAGTVRCEVARAGTGHGLQLWFDAELMPGIRFSTAPPAPESVYGTGFFPWPKPVELAAGDVAEIALQADLIGGSYVWRWATRVFDAGRADRVKESFLQSTFHGTPTSIDALHRQAPGHRPGVTDDLAMDRHLLGLFDGERSLAEIAEAAASRFPDRFGPGRDALVYVVALAARYRA